MPKWFGSHKPKSDRFTQEQLQATADALWLAPTIVTLTALREQPVLMLSTELCEYVQSLVDSISSDWAYAANIPRRYLDLLKDVNSRGIEAAWPRFEKSMMVEPSPDEVKLAIREYGSKIDAIAKCDLLPIVCPGIMRDAARLV